MKPISKKQFGNNGKYYKDNPETKIAYQRKYYQENREKILEKRKKCQKNK